MSRPVADDVDFIAKRLKELEEERERIRQLTEVGELPSDVEPSGYRDGELWALPDACASCGKDLTLACSCHKPQRKSPNIYGDPFWDALVRNGVIKVVEA